MQSQPQPPEVKSVAPLFDSDWDTELEFEPDLTEIDLAELQQPLPETQPLPEIKSPPLLQQPSPEIKPASLETLLQQPLLSWEADDVETRVSEVSVVTPEGITQLLQLFPDLTATQPQPTPVHPLPPVAPPITPVPAIGTARDRTWYLALDIGTTGISAVLLNRSNCQLFPLYWLEIAAVNSGAAQSLQAGKTFRLPLAVELLNEQVDAVAVPSLSGATTSANPAGTTSAQPAKLLQGFKPWLKIGIPYTIAQTQKWQPVVQWSEQQTLPLHTFHQALQKLLATLTQVSIEGIAEGRQPTPNLTCGAVGLEDSDLQAALQQLAGVVVGYPANWPDAYPFNVREVILGANLVSRPEQVFFLEDAIALALAQLPASDGQPITLPPGQPRPTNPEDFGRGNTLIIHAGAVASELSLVNLPEALQVLTHHDFNLRSVTYGGNALDQDIICRLIYPAWLRQSLAETRIQAVPDWHIPHPPSQDLWDILQWHTLTLPPPGEPDPINRQRLQRRLLSFPLGEQLLEAARRLKVSLQQQDRFTLQLGNRLLVMTRHDLSANVLLYYVQRLNRELNALLNQSNLAPVEVNQVICSGGSASFGAIARWLRQKLPNAIITQDTYAQAGTANEIVPPTWSRVAYGLATLPLHPGVLDSARQQYSVYFLLMELLRSCPDAPFTLSSLMAILVRRGIVLESSQNHILALLEGHFPPGLVPTERDRDLLAPISQTNPDYQQLLATPLFHKENSQTYRINLEQKAVICRYFNLLLANAHQSLTEPLPLELA